jgi:hypothetical protein
MQGGSCACSRTPRKLFEANPEGLYLQRTQRATTAALDEDLVFPFRLLVLQVSRDVLGRAAFDVGLGILKVALEVARGFDVFSLCAAAKDILKRSPIHFRAIAAGQVFEVLLHVRRVSHLSYYRTRSKESSCFKSMTYKDLHMK